MKRRALCLLLCAALISALFTLSPSAGLSEAEIAEFHCTETRDTKTSPYWFNSRTIYGGEKAAEAGVPEGYEGLVMKLVGDSAVGFTVDFSELCIPVSSVKALHMRVYYTDKQREVRVTIDAGTSWVLRHEAKKPGAWEDVVITDAASLKLLADDDGRLGVFGFGFRNYDGTRNSTVYVDEIRAELIDPDSDPPVIRYDGPDHVITTEGKRFVLPVTAYDEYEKVDFPISYEWDKPATDGDGNLVRGEYTLTMRASDSFGNSAEKVLTVSVGERDTEAPVIRFTPTVIDTVAGAYNALSFEATDNCDDVTVVQSWSEGALDRQMRLTEGTHTLTLTASDLTGNSTEMTITVNAAKTLK